MNPAPSVRHKIRRKRSVRHEDTKKTGMETLKKDFEKSGYSRNELLKIEERLSTQPNEETRPNESGETITFPLFFFDGLNEFKKIDPRLQTGSTTTDWRHENHDGCEEEPLDRQQEHPKQIAQRKTNIVTQPKMQRTKLPSMPTGKHLEHIDRQQHQNPFRKNTELQITKRYLFMAMPTLQTSKTK